MLDLDPTAVAFFQSLPESSRIALEHSNLTFHTIHYLKKYGKTKTQIDTSQPQTNGLEPRGYKPASSATTVSQTEPVVNSGDTTSVGADDLEPITPQQAQMINIMVSNIR